MKKQIILAVVILSLMNGCIMKKAFNGGKGHGRSNKASIDRH